MDELRKFIAPEFIMGPNALCSTGSYVRQFGAKKVLVVTDKGVQEAGLTVHKQPILNIFDSFARPTPGAYRVQHR